MNYQRCFRVYAAQPREGTETPAPCTCSRTRPPGLCSSTPRGDGNTARMEERSGGALLRFMQLNPARGRKLTPWARSGHDCTSQVYAAQPREGTETRTLSRSALHAHTRFMQLNPARGRKPARRGCPPRPWRARFMQLNPARGRKP